MHPPRALPPTMRPRPASLAGRSAPACTSPCACGPWSAPRRWSGCCLPAAARRPRAGAAAAPGPDPVAPLRAGAPGPRRAAQPRAHAAPRAAHPVAAGRANPAATLLVMPARRSWPWCAWPALTASPRQWRVGRRLAADWMEQNPILAAGLDPALAGPPPGLLVPGAGRGRRRPAGGRAAALAPGPLPAGPLPRPQPRAPRGRSPSRLVAARPARRRPPAHRDRAAALARRCHPASSPAEIEAQVAGDGGHVSGSL